jgi:hypothetical protein
MSNKIPNCCPPSPILPRYRPSINSSHIQSMTGTIIRQAGLLLGISLLLWVNHLCGQSRGKQPHGCKKHYDKRIAAVVYLQPSRLAEFHGGKGAWTRFLNKNFRYPKQEIDSGSLQSTAVATFIIDSTGLLMFIEIKGKNKSDWTPFERAFVRLLSESGLWKPAECNGRPVSSYLEQAIEVKLET